MFCLVWHRGGFLNVFVSLTFLTFFTDQMKPYGAHGKALSMFYLCTLYIILYVSDMF